MEIETSQNNVVVISGEYKANSYYPQYVVFVSSSSSLQLVILQYRAGNHLIKNVFRKPQTTPNKLFAARDIISYSIASLFEAATVRQYIRKNHNLLF